MVIAAWISTRSNRLTNQIIHDCCITLLLGLRRCPTTALLMFLGSCMARTLVSRLDRVQMPMVLIMTMVGSHISPRILNSDRRLRPLLVHLILHEDGSL